MVSSATGSGGSPVSRGVGVRLLLLLVEVYRVLLSPLVGGHCRFWPSCSEYAKEALERHGASRGVVLAARRLSRCHPFHAGGVDLVP